MTLPASIRYLLTRLAYIASLWFGVTATTFALFHVVPTDPARTMLGGTASEEQVAALRHELGLDRPIPEQFQRYLAGLARLDFGRSFVDRRPVGPEVFKRLQVTAVLASTSTIVICTYLAIALSLASRAPLLAEATDFACVSTPTLFSAMVVALGSVTFYPFTRFSGTFASPQDWLFLLPAAVVLALYPMGVLGRIGRARIQEVLLFDHVRAARALGLRERTILYKHVLRNALVPLLATFSVQLPLMLTNTFVVEIVFSVPGIGSLLLRSVLERDLPMLQGISIVTASFLLVLYVIVDLLYPIIDPRIARTLNA